MKKTAGMIIILFTSSAMAEKNLPIAYPVKEEVIIINGMKYKESYLECLVDKDRKRKKFLKGLAKQNKTTIQAMKKKGITSFDTKPECFNY